MYMEAERVQKFSTLKCHGNQLRNGKLHTFRSL